MFNEKNIICYGVFLMIVWVEMMCFLLVMSNRINVLIVVIILIGKFFFFS